MYTRNYRSFTAIIKSFGLHFAWYGPYVTAIYFAYEYLGWEALDIKMSIATVLGFAVALLLGFRTSASYDRWWEARKIWGGIVNDSRTLVRNCIGYMGLEGHQSDIERMAKYQMAWNLALKNGLRGLKTAKEITPYLTAEELTQVTGAQNVPNAILKLMTQLILDWHTAGKIDSFQMVSLNETLKQLCDHMGKAERIKNTVFPVQYRIYTHEGLMIFCVMLPYGMLLSTGPFVILICTLVFFFFHMLENIAYFLQDPFSNRGSDIPMSSLCKTIEINLKQLVGMDNVPEKPAPDKNGVMM